MKKGFTLAEVLITLGVIGVVAAITIPNLIQNYKKHVLENRLKQTVSILQQAVVRSSVDNGTPDTWGVNGFDSTIFEVYIKPYLSVVKTCTNSSDASCNINFNYQGTGSGKWVDARYAKKYILNNGSAIIYYPAGNYGHRRGLFLIVPFNTNKNLIYGKNIFTFNFIIEDNKTYSITSKRDYDLTLDFCKQINKTTLYDYCQNGTGGAGFADGITCSAIIECNGWKFPDDYPIRL